MTVDLTDIIAMGALGVAATSAAIALAGLRHSIKTRRDMIRAAQPNVETTAWRAPQPGWYVLTVRLRSRDNLGYVGESLSLRRPRRARLLTRTEAYAVNTTRPEDLHTPLPAAKAARRKPSRLKVAPAGTERLGGAWALVSVGEGDQESFLLFAPPSRLSILLSSLRIIRLSEMTVVRASLRVRARDAASTKTTIAVTITLQRDTATAA